MTHVFSDTDDFSDSGTNPDFHVVPSSSQYDPEDERTPLVDQEQNDQENKEQQEEEDGEVKPIEWHPAVQFIASTLKKALTPVVKLVFNPKTQRTMIKSLVIIIVLAWILLTSFTAYLTFYQRYIPKTAHVESIYFQYTQTDRPYGQVQLRGPHPTKPLRSDQAYDVSVQLHVPTSDINFNLGNFMVDVELQTRNGTVLAHSSRPAILRYQSATQRIINVLAKALPLLIGWTEESQTITVKLLENFIEQDDKSVTQAMVRLSTTKVQVYDAYISVIADFRGLRYYMYHRRISTATVFIILFTCIELIFASVAWRMFGKTMWEKLNEAFESDEDVSNEEEEEQVSIEDREEQQQTESQYTDDEYLTEEERDQ